MLSPIKPQEKINVLIKLSLIFICDSLNQIYLFCFNERERSISLTVTNYIFVILKLLANLSSTFLYFWQHNLLHHSVTLKLTFHDHCPIL